MKKPTKAHLQFAVTLQNIGACSDAQDWVETKGYDLPAAWNNCAEPSWLFWSAGAVGVSRQDIVRAACACARLVLHLVKEEEKRPRIAIETAEKWARGEATIKQLKEASKGAWDAAKTVFRDDIQVAYAAYAAADAADAAYADAYVDGAAAVNTAPAEARGEMRQKCCAAIREIITLGAIVQAVAEMEGKR